MKNWVLITLFHCSFQVSFAQNPKNLFINGSFDGVKGENSHGQGWITSSTPDLNDTTGNVNTSSGYTWIKNPIPSYNGGTWQNLYGDGESLQQEVQLEVGKIYTIQFEYAAQGITAGIWEFSSPVGINIYMDNVLVFKSPQDKTPYTWEKICYQFIAKSSTTHIKFSATDEQYVAIDGASLLKGNLCITP